MVAIRIEKTLQAAQKPLPAPRAGASVWHRGRGRVRHECNSAGFREPFLGSRICHARPTGCAWARARWGRRDRKSTRLNSSHGYISYAVFCLKKKKREIARRDV